MSPDQSSDPEFETAVLTEFNAVLLEYCEQVREGPRIDRGRLDVVITIVTARSVPWLRTELDPRARRILHRELRGAHLDSVVFAVDKQLSAPHYQVTVDGCRRPPTGRDTQLHDTQLHDNTRRGTVKHTLVDNGDETGAHPHGDGGGPGPAHPVLVLTLRYGHDLSYEFPLSVTSSWLAIRRGPAARDHRHELPLPNHLYAVPAGALLQLRYWRGRVELRREAVKEHYSVQVDGHWLAPGQRIQIGDNGWIAYARGDQRTVLNYLLKEHE